MSVWRIQHIEDLERSDNIHSGGIHDGTVLMEGTPDEVIGHHAVREVYLGDRFTI